MSEKKNVESDKKSVMEEAALQDQCVTPAIAQVDAPADLQQGIIEIADKDEYVDEP
ncbi:hypothetical protein [Paenibacillus apiarius]|uniref:Uncharacterized protein n=1 Tax=Paenibacillus apiarius TaxID=46240 RepID=A0ABT4DQI3_9BACL|nr:hypothetical protein [Paenibacillus apiarius]MBN3526907.1 hypothetical protein [Paenibacillus apiarius]MCY9513417.1 hypothetical protein [Paenibacillus apiarius]MCY9519610.1 hypothetical protein [Paenibacillus apiarius]MCY9553333.1 hypothetical protein [Paenibacillus apiarius]MCY9557183.1 hypothetical protein [Paenibacillus apiarius]